MGRFPASVVTIIGAILAILGLVGLASPVFKTRETKDVAKIGDLKIEATVDKAHAVPPLVSGGALAVGLLLIGAGFYQQRR